MKAQTTIGSCTCGPCVRGEPCQQVQTHIAVELEEGAVAHVSPDAPAPLMDALGKMVTAAREHFSPHAKFARRLRSLADDARSDNMHVLGGVCDEMAEELEKTAYAKVDKRHKYVPDRKFPWFCGKCGYAEHEALMHFPNAQDHGSR